MSEERVRAPYSKDYKHNCWQRRETFYWGMTYIKRFNCYPGEIYEVDWGENLDSEFSGRHLGMVLKESVALNDRVLMIPLSSRIYQYNVKDILHMTYGKANLEQDSAIIVNEQRYISKIRIYPHSIIFPEVEMDGCRIGKAVNLTPTQIDEYANYKL